MYLSLGKSVIKPITLALCFVLLFAGSSFAAAYTVNTLDDFDDGVCNSAHCSLREAVVAANTHQGNDSITFTVTGSIPLQSTLPPINDTTGSLAIIGPGNTRLEIDGSNATLPFFVMSGNNSISGLGFKSKGIIIYNSSNNTVTSSHIYGVSDGNGLAIDGASENNSITFNLTDNNQTGIVVSGARNNLLGNKSTKNKYHGILLIGGCYNTLTFNQSLENGLFGIELSGFRTGSGPATNNTIKNNEFSKNKLFGILLNEYADWNVFQNNSAKYNESDGIQVWESFDNIFKSNVVLGNKNNGIYVMLGSSRNNFEANNIIDNALQTSSVYLASCAPLSYAGVDYVAYGPDGAAASLFVFDYDGGPPHLVSNEQTEVLGMSCVNPLNVGLVSGTLNGAPMKVTIYTNMDRALFDGFLYPIFLHDYQVDYWQDGIWVPQGEGLDFQWNPAPDIQIVNGYTNPASLTFSAYRYLYAGMNVEQSNSNSFNKNSFFHNGNGYSVGSSSDNNINRDTILNSLSFDIKAGGNSALCANNTVFTQSKVYVEPDSESSVAVYFNAKVKAQNSQGSPIPQAMVTVFNKSGAQLFQGLTDQQGMTSLNNFYCYTLTENGVSDNQNPHRVEIVKAGYLTLIKQINITLRDQVIVGVLLPSRVKE